MLEVDHCGLGTGLPHVASVVGVADQRDDLGIALGEDLGETQGDLAVASGDGYAHGFSLRTPLCRPTGTRRRRRVGSPDPLPGRQHSLRKARTSAQNRSGACTELT